MCVFIEKSARPRGHKNKSLPKESIFKLPHLLGRVRAGVWITPHAIIVFWELWGNFPVL
jgi:hypothetical protein